MVRSQASGLVLWSRGSRRRERCRGFDGLRGPVAISGAGRCFATASSWPGRCWRERIHGADAVVIVAESSKFRRLGLAGRCVSAMATPLIESNRPQEPLLDRR